jgi:hypothetical protein
MVSPLRFQLLGSVDLKTNAARILDGLGIRYQLREYQVDEEDLSAGSVASKVGLPADQVLKTLVCRGARHLIGDVWSAPRHVAHASHLRYIAGMKTSTLPPLRVEPLLRSEAERLLRDGETLSSFIVDAVTEHVRNRAAQDEFVRRGLASGEKARRSGKYTPAVLVVAGLRRKLAHARKEAVHQGGGKRRRAR